jgi:hypothetical protein
MSKSLKNSFDTNWIRFLLLGSKSKREVEVRFSAELIARTQGYLL